jgi:16S rRNA G527 N7-methylase RsmG
MQDIWQSLINLFIDRNNKINLSAIRNEEGIKTKHIKDSLTVLTDKFLSKFPQIKNLFQKK